MVRSAEQPLAEHPGSSVIPSLDRTRVAANYCDRSGARMRAYRRFGAAVVLVLSAVSCGGRTDTDDRVGVDGGSSATHTPAGAADGGRSAEQPLEECVEEGFPYYAANGRPCTYFADELCYETLSQACACTCPRDHDSTCIAGLWPDDLGRIDVFCE